MSDDREKQDREDMIFLLSHPQFHRFLLRAIQSARIFSSTTDGSEGRHLAFDEGRRSLGLDILSMVEAGQPVSHPEGLPVLTLLQILREEANRQPQGKPKHDRYDRNSELNNGTDGDD
jgi:hypothetical protein